MQRATLALVAIALLSAISLPAYEIASCPLLHPADHNHPCCPKSKPAGPPPLSACISACGTSTGMFVPAKLASKPDIAISATVVAPAVAQIVAGAVRGGMQLDTSPPQRDLYLELGVIRR